MHWFYGTSDVEFLLCRLGTWMAWVSYVYGKRRLQEKGFSLVWFSDYSSTYTREWLTWIDTNDGVNIINEIIAINVGDKVLTISLGNSKKPTANQINAYTSCVHITYKGIEIFLLSYTFYADKLVNKCPLLKFLTNSGGNVFSWQNAINYNNISTKLFCLNQ